MLGDAAGGRDAALRPRRDVPLEQRMPRGNEEAGEENEAKQDAERAHHSGRGSAPADEDGHKGDGRGDEVGISLPPAHLTGGLVEHEFENVNARQRGGRYDQRRQRPPFSV